MQIIDGKKIAQEISEKLKIQPMSEKIFAAILVGDDKISENFVKQKERVAKELGIDFRIYKFSAELKNDELREEVRKIALLKKVGGVIVQLPLPEHINKHYVLNVIPREKDVDVLGERALGAFYTNRNLVLPPAVETIFEILKKPEVLFEKNVSEVERAWSPSEARRSEGESQAASERLGERDRAFSKIKPLAIAVVGAGFLIGKPIAVWLMNNKVKELKIFEKGSDLSSPPAGGLKNYDLIISGVGKAGLIKSEMLKQDVAVIDFGYSTDENRKISGDFDASQIENYKLKIENLWYTPTPGGTGPILVAKLFENFYKLNNE